MSMQSVSERALQLADSCGEVPCQELYFMHIPKTAGTSIRYWLHDLFEERELLPCDIIEQLETTDRDAINRYRLFSGHFGAHLHHYLDRSIPTITWLREPLARERSHFRFIRQKYEDLARIARTHGQEDWIKYYDLVREKSLAEICQAPYYIGFSDNLQTRHLSGAFPTKGALEVTSSMLDTAKSNLAQLFFFGICEWMPHSIDMLTYQLACPYRPLTFHENCTSNQNETREVDAEPHEAETVLDINRFDLELYRFGQELFAARWESFAKRLGLQVSPAHSAKDQLQRSFDTDRDRVIRTQINQNFQDRRANVGQVAVADVNFKDAVFHSGWYPRIKVEDDKSIRWAGPCLEASIFLPLENNHSYHLEFDVQFVASYEILKTLQFRIGDERFPMKWKLLSSKPRSVYRVSATIPRHAIQRDQCFTEIIFTSTEVIASRSSSDPTRRVSFATDEFRLRAA